MKTNPYRPGAGFMPPFLAGREQIIEEVDYALSSLQAHIPQQSIIFTGLRGVGKTVLLNHLMEKAREKGISCVYLEVDPTQNFAKQITTFSQKYMRETQLSEKAKNLFVGLLECIKSFAVSYDPEDQTFSLSVQDRQMYSLADKEQSMIDLFLKLGETAQKTKKPICIFLDEMQYMDTVQMGHLIASIHRCNQMNYPIMLCGAGLPKLIKMLADVKSYSERLFSYYEIGALTENDAKKAICIPVEHTKYSYSENAIASILSKTSGYPFFVQQYCFEIFRMPFNGTEITENIVEQAEEKFDTALAGSFFKSRYEKCSPSEVKFIFAMVACGDLPCTMANVAKNMKKTVQSISALRAQLINKGIIYSAKHGEVDFTVPHFDRYIRTLPEYHDFLGES